MNDRVSYWLVPAEPAKQSFQQTIRELAMRFDAPIFEPHVTLYSGPLDARDDIAGIIRAATSGLSEIVLAPTGIARSEQFTKTLFVQFAASDALTRLSDALRRRSAQPRPYELRPHLSLIYASLSAEVKEGAASEIPLPPAVRFDVVKVIVGRDRTQTREDVQAWRAVAECVLGKAS